MPTFTPSSTSYQPGVRLLAGLSRSPGPRERRPPCRKPRTPRLLDHRESVSACAAACAIAPPRF